MPRNHSFLNRFTIQVMLAIASAIEYVTAIEQRREEVNRHNYLEHAQSRGPEDLWDDMVVYNDIASKIEKDSRFRSDMKDSVIIIQQDGVKYHAKAFGGAVAQIGDQILRGAGVNLNIPELVSFNAQIDVVDISGNVVAKTNSAVSLREHDDGISLLSDEPFEGQDKFDAKVKDHIAKFDKEKRIAILSQISKTQILGYCDIVTSRNFFTKDGYLAALDCDSFGTPFFDMKKYCSSDSDYQDLVREMQDFIESDDFFEAQQRKLDFLANNAVEGEESFFYQDHEKGFDAVEKVLESGAVNPLAQKNKYPDLDSFYHYKGGIIYASWCERDSDFEMDQDVWGVARRDNLIISVDKKEARTIVLNEEASDSYYMLQPVGDLKQHSYPRSDAFSPVSQSLTNKQQEYVERK